MILPKELETIKSVKQWVGHKNKIPINPHTGRNGSSTDPSTWGTYEEALQAVTNYNLDCVGFVLAGGYFGIDLDHVIEDDKLISKEAADIIKIMDSYTEISPSGTGIHIIAKGTIPGVIGASANKTIEMYQNGRYFTVTGNIYKEPKPIEERSKEGTQIYNYYTQTEQPAQNTIPTGTIGSGSRNSTLISLIGSLRSKGLDREAIEETIRYVNKTQCKPPLSDRELERNVLSALNRRFEHDNKYVATVQETPQREITIEVEPVGAYISEFKDFCTASRENISTGILSLDIALNGGLTDELYILGAETGQGKSAFSMQLAQNIASQGHDVLYFALEMSRKELIARGVSAISYEKQTEYKKEPVTAGNILYYKYDPVLKNFTKLAYSHYEQATKEYFKRYSEHLYIFENDNERGVTVLDIDAITRKHVETTGNKPIVFVDYLQMITADSTDRTQIQSTKGKVDASVRVLKALSIDLSIPVFTISSINRAGYGKRISASSFKESGDLEYTGGILLGLNLEANIRQGNKSPEDAEKAIREANQASPRKMLLEVLKFRNGIKNNDVALNYYSAYNYFELNKEADSNHLQNSVKDWKDDQARKEAIERVKRQNTK